jgi:hypothetical protein
MKFREVVRLPEFEREFKRLLMKHNTLEEDLAKFIDRQLFIYHKLGLDNRGVSTRDVDRQRDLVRKPFGGPRVRLRRFRRKTEG